MEQFDLLGCPSKQSAHVESSHETKLNVAITLISGILLKSSVEMGKEHLDMISNIIYNTLEMILDCKDKLSAIKIFMEAFHPDSREKLLSTSRTSIENNLMNNTKEKQDKHLQNNYIRCIKQLDNFNAQSPEVVLSIDTTFEEARSKYENNQFSYGIKGQNNTWKRGFNYSAIYDSTHQQFISAKHINYHMASNQNGGTQAIIDQIKNACEIVEGLGSHVTIINGDRGYFKPELFAASYLNQLNPSCNHNSHTKVIVPRKFTREKEPSKIEFLENPNAQTVSIYFMKLPKNSVNSLIDICKRKNLEFDSANYLIPVYNVAIVDGYSTNKHRTVDKLRSQWKINEDKINDAKLRIKQYENEYYNVQKQAGISKPAKLIRVT
jgi:hypothetical protein